MNDDDILDKLYSFLRNNIHAEHREFKGDEARFFNEDGKSVIIPVVKRKQAPSLERRVEKNTSEGVATLMLFAKSFYSKQSRYYGKHGITNWTRTQDTPAIFRVSRPLSTAEMLWLDVHGNPIFNYHAKKNNISAYNMKRFSFNVVANELSRRSKRVIEPFGALANDITLRDTCRYLKETYGEVLKHIDKEFHERIKDISMMIDLRERERQVLLDKYFSQGKVYKLHAVKKGKYLFAMPVPYEQTQLSLFNNLADYAT